MCFGQPESNLAFLDPTLSYDANNVFLTLTRNNIDFVANEIMNAMASGDTVELARWADFAMPAGVPVGIADEALAIYEALRANRLTI